METMRVELTLLEELLGTKATDPEAFLKYIAAKKVGGPAEDELARVQRVANKGKDEDEVEMPTITVFHREDGVAGIYDYQVKGFFKDACGALRRAPDTLSKDLKAYKTVIDGLVFPMPRFIKVQLPEGGQITVCERPLRADTPMGPRVAICRSEALPVGSKLVVDIQLLDPKLGKLVREWLDYGKLRGLGQWRNSGKGRFTWKELTE